MEDLGSELAIQGVDTSETELQDPELEVMSRTASRASENNDGGFAV
jgi:hypothetical protein